MIAIWVSVGILAVAVVLGLLQIARATDGASRAVVGDLVFFSAVGMLALLGVLKASAAVADAVMLASMVGVLATVALARIITRGRR